EDGIRCFHVTGVQTCTLPISVLDELKRAGWLRAFGMSTKTLEGGLLTAQHADLVMVTYNLDHRAEEAVLDECRRLNKGVLIKKALASGHLCIGTTEEDPVQASMNRSE